MIARDSGQEACPLEVLAILLGLAIGLTIFATFEACQQTLRIYSRTKSATNLYLWMIWILLLANIFQAVVSWLRANGNVAKSIGSSIGSFVIWIIQTQLAPQILANRLGLLLVDKKRARLMKIMLVAIVGVINISVTCIYFIGSAVNPNYYTQLHKIWDPIDKGVDLLIDISLNVLFLRIIQHELIANGLVKYRPLFYRGVVFVFISICVDVLVIVMTTVTEPFLYAMTHPLAYMVKLIMEMTMADLIMLVAKTPHQIQDVSV